LNRISTSNKCEAGFGIETVNAMSGTAGFASTTAGVFEGLGRFWAFDS